MTDRIATGNIYPKTQSPNGKLPNIKNGYSKKTTTLLYSASVTCLDDSAVSVPSVAV